MVPFRATTAVLTLTAITAAAPVPTPIGFGPRYLPPAVGPLVSSSSCFFGPLRICGRVHLELFANRRAIVIPAAVGVRRPRLRLGTVVSAHCHARLRTLDPTGVIWFEGAANLGDFFAAWGHPLSSDRLLSFHTRSPLLLFRNGGRWRGNPRQLPLRDGDQVVVEIGGYVRPHRSFLFPPRG
jgi:hypothetical protein